MNRKIFLIIVSTALFAAVFTSCSKDNDGYSSPTPFSGALSGVIEGVCASWDFVGISFGEGDIVETTPIIDGKFTFSSLPTPKPEDLAPFIDSEVPIDIQISDRNAKICSMSLIAFKGEVGASFEARSIVQGTYVFAPISVNIVMYYYADKDLKVKGSWSGTTMGITVSSEININLKRGWNTLQMIVSGSEESRVTILKNGVPSSGTAWTGVII